MLAFSSNFPASLQRAASLLHTKADYSGNLEKAALIARLTADCRMDAVWNELTKRERSDYKPTTKFFRPAFPPLEAPAISAEDAQTKALEELFYRIVITVECSWLLLTDPVPGVADLLLQKADRLRGSNSRRSKSKARQLSKAAKVYSSVPKANPEREVALGLAAYFEERFRNPMYGTVATIVSVALETNVTRAMLKSWCAGSGLKGGQNDRPGAHF